jgi:hypothetical protein
MQSKDRRVLKLAQEIVSLMRQHPRRHEAFEALDIAKLLFRPELPPGINDRETAVQSLSKDHVSLLATQ